MAMSDETDSLDVALGQSIRRHRKKAGLTLRTLGERSGLSFSFLSDLENGKRSVSVRNLYALANALSVAPAELLPDEAKWLDDVGSL